MKGKCREEAGMCMSRKMLGVRNEGKEGTPSRSLNHSGSPPDTRHARTLYAFPWGKPPESFRIRTRCRAASFHTDYRSLLPNKLYTYAFWHSSFWLTRGSLFMKYLFFARQRTGEFQSQGLYRWCAQKSINKGLRESNSCVRMRECSMNPVVFGPGGCR